jgi:hypothetical protein
MIEFFVHLTGIGQRPRNLTPKRLAKLSPKPMNACLQRRER